ncbi:MAG TPA: guanylate kinase [Anaeromyxobacteraceae bacterium]|jgi:guanylate kinase|nr:guanylate kinase [Anaeromyxobacteraceae bacterium]
MSSEPAAGQLLVLSAPSGAGKTTLARLFVERTPGAAFSVSATTRAPRGAERDGVDYHFLSPEEFEARRARGELAEWAEVHGRRYGTLRATVDESLRRGRVTVFDIDVQGGEQILSRWPDATVTVLVVPPSPAELERRLRGRSTESDEAVRARLAAARAEVARAALHYEYVLVNDRVEEALSRLLSISRWRRGAGAGPDDARIARESAAGRVDLSAWTA